MAVGGPAHHHRIHPLQLELAGGQILQAAIEFDLQLGPLLFELVHQPIAQGWHAAVLFGIEALEPGLAGVHAETAGPGGSHGVHEVEQFGVGIARIDADPVFHAHRQARGGGHGGNAVGHPGRFRHQAGTEAAFLHLRAGTAHVEIDLVVAPGRR